MDNIYFLNGIFATKYFEMCAEKVYGNMYRLKDGRLIKRYDEEKIRGRSVDFSRDRLLDFRNMEIEGISFIRALVYTGLFDIYATVTRDVPGISLDKMSLGNYQIDKLIQAIRKFETTIRNLSDNGISATMDVYIGNMVYDGDRITLIDTAEYYYKEGSIEKVYEDNMLSLMYDIFFNIFTVTGYNEIYYLKEYFKMRSSKYAKFESKEFLLNPVESLIEMRRLIEEDFGMKLDTFNDCHVLLAGAVEKEKCRRRILQSTCK